MEAGDCGYMKMATCQSRRPTFEEFLAFEGIAELLALLNGSVEIIRTQVLTVAESRKIG